MTKIYRDCTAWRSQTIEQQIEEMRRHYCTGPCGQSQDVLTTRSNTDYTLRAIKGLLASPTPTTAAKMVSAAKEVLEAVEVDDRSSPQLTVARMKLMKACAGLQNALAELEPVNAEKVE